MSIMQTFLIWKIRCLRCQSILASAICSLAVSHNWEAKLCLHVCNMAYKTDWSVKRLTLPNEKFEVQAKLVGITHLILPNDNTKGKVGYGTKLIWLRKIKKFKCLFLNKFFLTTVLGSMIIFRVLSWNYHGVHNVFIIHIHLTKSLC